MSWFLSSSWLLLQAYLLSLAHWELTPIDFHWKQKSCQLRKISCLSRTGIQDHFHKANRCFGLEPIRLARLSSPHKETLECRLVPRYWRRKRLGQTAYLLQLHFSYSRNLHRAILAPIPTPWPTIPHKLQGWAMRKAGCHQMTCTWSDPERSELRQTFVKELKFYKVIKN